MLKVIGEADPKRFDPYLEQPAETELSEAYLFFNPRMGEFGDGAPLFVNAFRLFSLHLL